MQKAIIGAGEATLEINPRLHGLCWQASAVEEVVSFGLPIILRQKERIELAKALAAADPDVTAPNFIAKRGENGTFISAAIGGVSRAHEGAQAFGDAAQRQRLGQLAPPG